MIIFLYGADSYRRRQKLKEIIEEYRQRGADNRRFDFNDSESEAAHGEPREEFMRIKEFVSNNSIFGDKKTAVIENIFSYENSKSAIKILKDNLESNDLILIVSEEKKPTKDFNFLLKKPVLFQEFKILESAQFEFFIKKEAEKRSLNLSARAIGFLAEIFKGDSWAMINELEKLSLISPENLEVDKLKEIIDYGQPIAQQKFFYAVNGILRNSSMEQKLVNLEILLSYQEEPAKIFNFLASLANTPLIIRKMADYDVAIKSGKMDYEEALVDFVLG